MQMLTTEAERYLWQLLHFVIGTMETPNKWLMSWRQQSGVLPCWDQAAKNKLFSKPSVH